MKCTACGNTNLLKTYFPLESYGDGGATLSKKVDVYLCLECGHFEFYSPKTINDYNETVSAIKETELTIDNLRQELELLQNSEISQKINDELKSIELQLKSIDITIRQQQELKDKYSKLKHTLLCVSDAPRYYMEHIAELESHLQTIKNNFEGGRYWDAESSQHHQWILSQCNSSKRPMAIIKSIV